MFSQIALPYSDQALEPYMSARTLTFHYGKHHRAYLNKLNELIIGSGLETETLENIIIKTAGDSQQITLFNNAAQYYNHNFFWAGLRPAEKKLDPNPELLTKLISSFGSLEGFYKIFTEQALNLFGSGWVWLFQDGDNLKIINTFNADNPLTQHLKPLWVLDIWEHAYYLDYQNRRVDFIEAVLKHLINWEFIATKL